MLSPPLYLASTSPRRRELLAQLGLEFAVLGVDVDESRYAAEAPAAYVARLAREKAAAGVAQIGEGVVVAADTSVVLGDEVLGKPPTLEVAMAMWQRLSAREHQVLTGVAVASAAGALVQVVTTRVWLREISHAEMQAYWESGEPRDKAGGYAIQGLGTIFVTGIEGSYSNVVGLPLAETAEMLARFGVAVLK